MAPRLLEYRSESAGNLDISIDTVRYRPQCWPSLDYEGMCYMESGFCFYGYLLQHNGLMLHASAVELDGYAYLFSGPCGRGKSTHTRLWQREFGPQVRIFNDDKPALRCLDDQWFAYGTPWCGKDGININMKVPLAGICFLEKGNQNAIRRLNVKEAALKVIWQTMRKFKLVENADLMLGHVDRLVRSVPMFELTNRADSQAAQLSYETMRREVYNAERQQ